MNLVCLQKIHQLQSKRAAGPCYAWPGAAQQKKDAVELCSTVPGRGFSACGLHEVSTPTRPVFSIQNVGDTEQVPWWENMDVDLFCSPGIGVPEDSADELDRNAFDVKFRGEIMPKRMRPEPRYAGLTGKFFTEAV